MASYPKLVRLAVRAFVDATQWNTVVDGVNFALQRPVCAAYSSVGIDVPNAAWTLMPLDVVRFEHDPDGLVSHSTAHPSRLVFNRDAVVRITPFSSYPANATGARLIQARINANGASGGGGGIDTDSRASAGANVVTTPRFSRLWSVTTNQYVEAFLYQTSGVLLTTSPTGCGIDIEFVSGS